MITVAALACIVLVTWVMTSSSRDPYVIATQALTGDATHGGLMFRINCAGCHGIAAQGLVGPSLQGLSSRLSDPQIIQQVVSGQTPPMPRFEMEPQQMADLLAHLHSISAPE